MSVFIFPAAGGGTNTEEYLNATSVNYVGDASSWVSWDGNTFTAAIEKKAVDPTTINNIGGFMWWDLSKVATDGGTVRTHLRITSTPVGDSADLLVPSGIVFAASEPPVLGTTSRWAELTLGYSVTSQNNNVGGVATASNNANPYNNGTQANPIESVEVNVLIRDSRILRTAVVWRDTGGTSDLLDLSTKTTITGTDSLYAWVALGWKGSGSGAAGSVSGTFHVDYTPVTA